MPKQLYFFLLLLSCSCSSSYPEGVEEALCLAGGNRKELEKVLKRYGKNPSDSLKLRAAEFLIANMPDKYSEYYAAPWNDVAAVHLRWSSSSNKPLVLDTYKLGSKVREDDVTHITGDYLISNIEQAFKVWEETPWGKDVPFAVFCEEILPYRLSTEPLESWREKALASFADVYSSFLSNDSTTTVAACTKVNSLLPRFALDRDFPVMSFSQLMASARSTCDGMTALAIFSMRALGIPVARDFTIKWPEVDIGHSWNSVYDGKGSHISFMGSESAPGKSHQGSTPAKHKTYRETFAKQRNIEADVEDIPQPLQNLYMKDASAEYAGNADIIVPALFQPAKPTGYAYLAARKGTEWLPTAWGNVEQSEIKFLSVGKKLIYLPVYYADGQQRAANYPFWVEEDGSLRFICTDSVQEVLSLEGITGQISWQAALMLHGYFEGANRSDFSDATRLHSIKEIRGGVYHTANVTAPSKYRYVRYFSPENGRCNLAELEFYDKNGAKLTGTVIGTPGSGEKMAISNAFDGDVTTVVNVDSLTYAWVGLDLGEPTAIGKVRYLPRSEGNNIYEGHTYELLYWDGQQWAALAPQIATSYQLRYRAPANGLFYLQNITLKKMGRYFTMEKGKQRWL
jgi:hypothetical protein